MPLPKAHSVGFRPFEVSKYGLTCTFHRIEQAITLRNNRAGGDHKGFEGLGGVDLPIFYSKYLLHGFGPVVADRGQYAETFLPTHPSGSSGDTVPKFRRSMSGGCCDRYVGST